MNEFTLKNYPAKILLPMIIFLMVLIEITFRVFQNEPIDLKLLLWPIGKIGILSTLFLLVNKYLVFNWYLKLLGLADIRGKYVGKLISSFHEDDDESKSNISMRMEIAIAQNINGIKIYGSTYPNKDDAQATSKFESEWANLQKLEHGKYLFEYRYSTEKSMEHEWDQKYKLNSHIGWVKLEYDPKEKTLIGVYATLENKSVGNLHLKFKGKG
jgi:hypothetical protein